MYEMRKGLRTMKREFTLEHRKKLSLKRKGKTYEEIFGIDKANKLKQKFSRLRKGKFSKRKGKSFDEIYGKEKGQLMRIKMSNSMQGKNIGKLHSNETKLKISLAKKGKTYEEILGSKEKAEQKKLKISLLNKGKKRTEEQCQNIKLHHVTRKNYIYSIETRKKISESNKKKGRKISEQHRTILRNNMLIRRKNIIYPVKDSNPEIRIQTLLRELNINFYTHHYIKEIKHGYQCDIFIPIYNLIIECDGLYWHNYPSGREIDRIRTNEVQEKGFRILRLWESEINIINKEKLLERILCEVKKNG